MKRIICLVLAVILCLSTCICNVFAEEDAEMSIKDMIDPNISLSNEIVAHSLRYYSYNPYWIPSGDWPFYMPLYIAYFPRDEHNNPILINPNEYENYEDVYNLFWDNLPIEREYLEKYLGIKESSVYLCNDSYANFPVPDGYHPAIVAGIHFTQTFYDEWSTYGSVERAFMLIELFETISSYKDIYVAMEPVAGGYNEYFDIFYYDVNYDGRLNSKDTVLLKRALLGENIRANHFALDICGDGKTNAKDALYLRKKILGLI